MGFDVGGRKWKTGQEKRSVVTIHLFLPRLLVRQSIAQSLQLEECSGANAALPSAASPNRRAPFFPNKICVRVQQTSTWDSEFFFEFMDDDFV